MIAVWSKKIVTTVNALIRKHLEWIYSMTTTRPVSVFIVCCLIFLLSCLSISRIRFEADIFKLFPQTGPLALFLDTMKWTGSAGNAYFLLEGDRDKLVKEAEVFAGKLHGLSVEGKPVFSKVQFRIFDPAEAQSFTEFMSYAVTRPQLFIAPADVPRYLRQLEPKSVSQALQRAKTELATPGMFTDVIAEDPFYLRELILPRLKTASQALDLDTESPYFLSRDGKVLIIIAEPSRPVTDIVFARKLVAAINGARAGAGIKISVAGAHLSAVTDESILKENIIVGVLSSLVVVLGLFYVAYRRFLPTALIPVILVYGVVLALGTDYSIHLYDRFHFERTRGKGSKEALRLAAVDTGHAIFTAAATTAFPFLALVVSDVKVLSELGLLVGLGVIFSLYATYFFLPPLLLFMEKRFPLREYRPLPGFGLGFFWELGKRRCRLNIVLVLGIVLCMIFAATGISFESELKNLQPRSSEAFLSQEKVEQHLSVSRKQLIVAVEGKKLSDVMSQGEKVDALANNMLKQGEIVSFSSLGQVINSASVQKKVAEELSSGLNGSRLANALVSGLEQQGFAAEPFQDHVQNLALLASARTLPVSEGIQKLSDSPFRGIIERHLFLDTGGYHLLTYLNYNGPEFRQTAFLNQLHRDVPHSRATSVDLVSGQLTDSVRHSFVWAIMTGGLMVLFLLLSHFNAPSGIFYSLFPVTAGAVAMLGIMALFGMRLNFMNVMVLVTIFGMGSDYGLHVAHRVRSCAEEEYKGRFIQAGRAVLLSGLTTIAGFGSLAFTDYGALASIGWATNFGIAATTLFTLWSLPAFMNYLHVGVDREKRWS